MDFLQTVNNRFHYFRRLLFRQSAASGQHIFRQIHSLQIIHDQIGCPVLLEKAARPDHVGMVKPCQCTGFLQKLFQAKTE